MRKLIALFVLFCAAGAHAEIWVPLEDYVGLCTAIVKAKTVSKANGQVEFELTEVWLGSVEKIAVNDRGHYVAYDGEHGVHVEVGQEIVFFFAGKERHGTSFPIKDGRLVYASTSDDYYREYTVDEFREAIIAAAPRTNPESAGPAHACGPAC